MWACIVVCPLWLEIPLRAALTVVAPHFKHLPFRMRETYRRLSQRSADCAAL
jgi:hypothetical protein